MTSPERVESVDPAARAVPPTAHWDASTSVRDTRPVQEPYQPATEPAPPTAAAAQPVPDRPPDWRQLVGELARYEHLDELDAEQFKAYIEAEATLEQMLMTQSTALAGNCEHAAANELIDQVIELNQKLRRIAEREWQRIADTDPQEADQYAEYRDIVDGLLPLLEGNKLTNAADARKLAGDLDGAIDLVQEALEYYAQVAGSDSPLALAGELRGRLAVAQARLFGSLLQTRLGNYRTANDELDHVRVVYEELLAEAEEETAHDEQLAAMIDGLVRELSSTLVDVTTLGAVNDLLLAAQNGRFQEVVDTGQAAVQAYKTSIAAVRSTGPNRNAVALREMELEYVQGWVHLGMAEVQMDQSNWEAAQASIRTAREHWKTMSRRGLRGLYAGVMAQRPDNASQEFLLEGALRRLDRDRRYLADIDQLRTSLHRLQLNNVQFNLNPQANAYAQGESRMSGDSHTFNGPVNAAVLGSHGKMDAVQQAVQQHAQPQPAPSQPAQPYPATAQPRPARPDGVDFRRLAEQLNDLAEVLSAGPRSTRERQSVELVRQATQAARRSDEAEARGYLAGTAPWVLEVAERIGADLAATVLRSTMGV